MIRKSALILLGGVALIGGAGYFFLNDSIVEGLAESAVQSGFAGEVRIDGLELRPGDMSVSLERLLIQDEQEPWKNMLETGHAQFDVLGMQLFAKKLVIKELTVEGLMLGKAREGESIATYDGKPLVIKEEALAAPAEAQEEGSEMEMPKLDLDALSQELDIEAYTSADQLKSVRQYELAKKNADERAEKLSQRSDQLEKDFKKFQADAKAAQKLKVKSPDDLKKAQEALKNLQDEAKRLQTEASQLQKDAKSDYAASKADFQKVEQMGKEDVKNVQKLAKIADLDASQIGKILFGESSMAQFEEILGYLKMARKFASKPEEDKPKPRGVGRTVTYPVTERVYPGLLVEKTLFSGNAIDDEGQIDYHVKGELTDLTSDPKALKKPTLLQMTATHPDDGSEYKVTGSFNHVGEKGLDRLKIQGTGLKMSDVSLGQSSKRMPQKLTAKEAKVTMEMVLHGNDLEGEIRLTAMDAQFLFAEATGELSETDQAIRGVFSDLKRINLVAKATGPLNSPHFSISTDLDDKLSKRFDRILGKKLAEAKKKIKDKIEGQYKEKKQEAEAKLNQQKAKLEAKAKKLQDQLKQQQNKLAKSLKEQQDKLGDQLKDQLGDKLKGKFGF